MMIEEEFFRFGKLTIAARKGLCHCCGVKTEKRGQIHCDRCYGRYLAFVLIPAGNITPPIDLSLFDKKKTKREKTR